MSGAGVGLVFLLSGTYVSVNEHLDNIEAASSVRQNPGESSAGSVGKIAVPPGVVEASPEPLDSPPSVPPPTPESKASPAAPEVAPPVYPEEEIAELAPPPPETGEQTTPLPQAPTGESLGEFKSTCYALPGTTATGTQTGPGTIAADPNVLPAGTEVYIEGYGKGTVEDTGGAIKGKVIDVWKRTKAVCRQWGIKFVEVWRRN